MRMPTTHGTTMESGRGTAFSRIAAPLLSALLFLSIFFLPIFGWAMNLFSPLPMVYYFFTQGRNPAQIAVVAAALAIGAAFGFKLGLFYLFSYGLLAMVMAEMINRRTAVERTVVYAAAVSFLSSAALVWFIAQTPVFEAYAAMKGQVAAMVELTAKAYMESGVSAEQIELITENTQWIAHWVVVLMPGSIMAGYLLMSLGNYIGYKLIQKRWPFLPLPDPQPILLWSPPEKAVFLAIAAGGMSMIPGAVIRPLGLNLLILVVMLYSLSGFCIIQHFFIRSRFPIFVRWATYILLLLQPFLISGIALLGLFDLWFDFRKIRRPRAGDKEG